MAIGSPGGSLFALVNDGECTEFDVDVVGPPHSAFSVRVDSTVVYPKSSVTFAFETSLATSGRNIEVSWARSPGGEKMHWSDWCPSLVSVGYKREA